MRPQFAGHVPLTFFHSFSSLPRGSIARIRPRIDSSWLHTSSPILDRGLDFKVYNRQFGRDNASIDSPRPYSTQIPSHPDSNRKHIAVLGGGISGLSTAYYITRMLPEAKVTLYEGSERLGGWLQRRSDQMGQVPCIEDLKLEDSMILIPKTSPGATNRFIYYPDHLVKMPGPGQNIFSMMGALLTEPVFGGIFNVVRSVVHEHSALPRPSSLQDESIGSFIERRFNSPIFAQNLASAVAHGIYAGNIYELSAKSLLPVAWALESIYGGLIMGALQMKKGAHLGTSADIKLLREMHPKVRMSPKLKDVSVYGFRGGIGTLSKALEKRLKGNSNVAFKMGQMVRGVEYDAAGEGVRIKTSLNRLPATYNTCISTLPLRYLSTIVPSNTLPSLSTLHSVTVMVVNLYFASPNLLPPSGGFGYLLPSSIPHTQNPERALGVIFDSSTFALLPSQGTSLTVMLGGHWWDSFTSYPTDSEGASMAKAVLKRHLGISEEPTHINVTLQKDCIPQYKVGYSATMEKANWEVRREFKGKLSVVGNAVNGVGVNDCVRGAREVVLAMKEGRDVTGLEGFGEVKLH
ncbi:hypothetical protein B7494_g2436 [Chlorociboria aeruginascens]|nr:hypothetical protein B7494_g2436 [Chlorociboria aeruginascens]